MKFIPPLIHVYCDAPLSGSDSYNSTLCYADVPASQLASVEHKATCPMCRELLSSRINKALAVPAYDDTNQPRLEFINQLSQLL